MNRRKAKQLITELQDELTSETVVKQFWLDKVQAYVQLIFGKSEQSVALPMFGTYYNDRYYNNSGNHDERAKEVTERLKELFDTYQKMIRNDVFLKRNIFSNDTNGTIAAWLIFIAGSLSGIAYAEGQRSENIDKKDLKAEIRKLQYHLDRAEYKYKIESSKNSLHYGKYWHTPYIKM